MVEEIDEIIENSFFVVSMFEDTWKYAMRLFFVDKDNFKAMMVLFPLLEHSLRKIYANSNGCSERMLTASTNSLYTTLDILLSPSMQGSQQKNRIFHILGNETTMNAIFDLLIWMEGPRVRDLLAHASVDPNSISLLQTRYLVSLCVSLLIQFDVRNNGRGYEESKGKFVSSCVRFVERYEPIFHPKVLLLETMSLKCMRAVEELKQSFYVVSKTEIKKQDKESKLMDFSVIEGSLQEKIDLLKNFFEKSLEEVCFSDFSLEGSSESLEKEFPKKRVEFHANMSESVLTTLKALKSTLEMVVILSKNVRNPLIRTLPLFSLKSEKQQKDDYFTGKDEGEYRRRKVKIY